MMFILGAIASIPIWIGSGYFIVKAISMWIENRRIAKQLNRIYKLCDEVELALKRDL